MAPALVYRHFMVPLIDLLWPILLATGAAFLVSGVLGLLLPTRAEVVAVQDAVAAGIQQLALRPGDYVLPLANGNDSVHGAPTCRFTVTQCGARSRASLWEGYAAYHLAVNIMVAYLAGLALLPGTDFNPVFRFAATVAFLGYGFTSLHEWLWRRTPWRRIWKPVCKGLVCSLVAGSIFASLWPAA
jgi:hypothetical protein